LSSCFVTGHNKFTPKNMSSSSKAASINEHFERLVQKLDVPPIPFYPKNLPKRQRVRQN
jgi:hypothetical protein